MNLICFQMAALLIVSIVGTSESSEKNNKIKIIIPHKISYIHHHHSKTTDFKSKKKLYLNQYEDGKYRNHHHHHHHHLEEESEEDADEYYPTGQDEEPDASYGDYAYYAIPPQEPPARGVKLLLRPMYYYNKSFHRIKHPPAYEFLRHEDYWQRMRHPREQYLSEDFNYK